MIFPNLSKVLEARLIAGGKTAGEAATIASDNLTAIASYAEVQFSAKCQQVISEETLRTETGALARRRSEIRSAVLSDIETWIDTNLLP